MEVPTLAILPKASIEVFLKPSSTLEGAAQAEGGCLVDDGMRMDGGGAKLIFVPTFGVPQG